MSGAARSIEGVRFDVVHVRSDVVVRPALPEEAAEVAWLAALTFPLACPPGTPVPTMAAHVADELTPSHFRAWAQSAEHALLVAVPDVAESSGPPPPPSLVGYVLVVLGEPEGEPEAAALRAAVGSGPYTELSKIYVHPGMHGTGISDALMEAATSAATDVARGAGYETGLPLWLGTNAQNLRAQAFYRRHGFEVVGRRTYVVGGAEHEDVVMLHTPDDR